MSFCIELFCVVTLQYQMMVRIAIAYFIIEKRKLRHSLGRPSRSDFVQSEIEATLGTQVDWLRSDDTKGSYIVIRLEGVSIENEADWTQMAKFHAEWSKKFYAVFVPYLKQK